MKRILLSGGAVAALFAYNPAQAQDRAADPAQAAAQPDNGIEDIVVTARRREESLQSVPVAISVTTGAALESKNIVKVEDLQRTTPGLGVSSTIRGSSTPAYAIRGQRTFDVGSNTDPSITLYFDEYGVTRNTGSNQLLFDLQSVQVLKGPQGTLFGRNTTGGAILVTPNEPTHDVDGYVKASVGSYSFRDLEGVLNVPLGEKAALRVSGKYTKRDGYMTNVITGEKVNDVDSLGVRAALLLEPADGFKSNTIGLYFKNDSNGTATKIDAVLPGRSPVPAVYVPLLNAEFAATSALGKYQFRSEIPDFLSKDLVKGVQNKTTMEITDNLTLKNIVGYRHIKSDYTVDTDGSALTLIGFTGHLVAKQFSEEFQLQAQMGIVELVGGVFYFRESSLDQTNSLQFAELTPPGRVPARVLQDFDTKNTSYAGFAHMNIDASGLTEGLSFSAGIRYTKDTREVTPRTRNPVFNTTLNAYTYQCALTGVINTSSDRNLCGSTGRATFKEPTWNVSANYQIDSGMLLYVAHRHGYKAGGINARPTPTTGFRPYDPEKVNDVEFGLKKDFRIGGMSGRVNTALYKTWLSDAQKNQNVIVTGAGGAPASTSIVTNAATATIKGAEFELVLRPTRDLDVTFGYAYTDPQYKKWFDSIVVGGVVTPVDISDSVFSYIPKHQLNASIRYELPLDDSIGKIALQGTAYYQTWVSNSDINSSNCGPGGAYTQCPNANSRLPGYALFTVRAEWNKPLGAPVDLAFFVENLTDKFYKNFGYTLLSNGFRSNGIGAPRMFGFSAKVPFGASAR